MTVFISEIRFENNLDFVEVVATNSEDLSGYSIAVYNSSGDVQYTHSLNGEFETTYAGTDGYLVDISEGLPDMGKNWGVALIDDLGNVVQFISGDGDITANDGPAAGEISDGQGNITSGGESLQTSDGGLTYYAQATPNPGVIPCFAPGTMIETPDGPRAVETLAAGDMVLTLDHGAQPILWAHSADQAFDSARDDQRPVLIGAGTLGPDRPATDLVVSPQHRILVGGKGQLQDIFPDQALAPAKALVDLPGVRYMRGRRDIVWHHFAFRRHEIVLSDGCWTESLLLGPMVVQGLPKSDRDALHKLFALNTEPLMQADV